MRFVHEYSKEKRFARAYLDEKIFILPRELKIECASLESLT